MGKPFTEFVLRLCTDKKALERFDRDPETDIKRHHFTEKQAAALMSRDSIRINAEICREWPEEEAGGHGGIKHVYLVAGWIVPSKARKGERKSISRKTSKNKRK